MVDLAFSVHGANLWWRPAEISADQVVTVEMCFNGKSSGMILASEDNTGNCVSRQKQVVSFTITENQPGEGLTHCCDLVSMSIGTILRVFLLTTNKNKLLSVDAQTKLF